MKKVTILTFLLLTTFSFSGCGIILPKTLTPEEYSKNLRNKFYNETELNEDVYKKTKSISSPAYRSNVISFRLVQASPSIFAASIAVNMSNWCFFKKVYSLEFSEHIVLHTDRSVKIDSTVSEYISILLKHEHLEEFDKNGANFKISGSRCDREFIVPKEVFQGFWMKSKEINLEEK